MQKITLLVLLSYCGILFFSGCAFPKIIVLEDPLSPVEHLNLGVTYEKNKDFENAVKQYRLAAEKLPLAYLYLGNAYFLKNNLNKAEKYYKKAIKKKISNADVYNNLAWLYCVKQENLTEAEQLALKAIETAPEKKDIYNHTLLKIKALKLSESEHRPQQVPEHRP
ncbi:MAG: tetratricopeptide repeat protein [Desulfobacterales bacterium]|nr:tetratricopeptide repeat protein [Desulfobacterales bacterium]